MCIRCLLLAGLRKLFTKIAEGETQEIRDKSFDELTDIVTLVQFANDECDYGEGLELGLNAFCFGTERLHSVILGLLPLAYKLLGRGAFAEIVTAHLADRKHGPVHELDQLGRAS